MIFDFLKRAAIIFLTKSPYRISRFAELYELPRGIEVDRPESLSAVLKYEPGEIIYYNGIRKAFSGQMKTRNIGNKERFRCSGLFTTGGRYIYSISDGCVLGQMGLIYNAAERSFIDESAKDWVINLKKSPYLNAWKLPEKRYLKGITYSYLTAGADGGFYHFLFESLIKAGMFISLPVDADHLLFNGPPTDWKLKWINKAGINTANIIWMDGSSHFECEQLIFTNKLILDQQVNQWCVQTLKSLFHIPLPNTIRSNSGNRIWITRKGLGQREIEWEDEILALFSDIRVIDLAHLDAGETIIQMQGASHIIGPHGAGLSNIYLCRPGTKVLEIYPENACFQPCYQRLSAVCKLQHQLAYLDFKNKANGKTGLHACTELLNEFLC